MNGTGALASGDVVSNRSLESSSSSSLGNNHHINSFNNNSISNMSVPFTAQHGRDGITLAGWRWHETSTFIVVSLFLLTGSLVKLAYHHTSLQRHLPESCILILLGTAFELLSFMSHFQAYIPKFSSEIFFFLLLPPIILESAYSLHDRIFFANIGTILLYAIAGTLINIFTIGPSLFLIGLTGIYGSGINPSLIECLIFSTLISAVDPVAVLAIFQEIGVNKALYFLVFGESLLNDAVVITLYNSITIFAGTVAITPVNLILGSLNFITVSGGGILIGMMWGIVTALVTRFTKEVRVIEPMIVIVIAYLSYVTAELFHFSGIIGIVGCGLMQMEYAKYNISNRSYVTIKYFTRSVSTIADVIIFFFLGKVLVRETHVWSTAFVLITTVLCIIFRFVSVFSLTYVANNIFHRIHRINLEEQLVMAYGGLRGAIAFSLAVSISESEVKHSRLFVSSTLFVILFTVFVLGSTTKTIVKLLRVKTEEKEDPKMFLFTNDKLIEGLMSGLEDVTGNQTYFHWINRLNHFNEKYVKRVLVRDWTNCTEFTATYQKVRSRNQRPKSILTSTTSATAAVMRGESVASNSGSLEGGTQTGSSISEENNNNNNNNHSSSGRPLFRKKTAIIVSPHHSPTTSSSSPHAAAGGNVGHHSQRNGSIVMYDQQGTAGTAAAAATDGSRSTTTMTEIVTDDEGLMNKIRGPNASAAAGAGGISSTTASNNTSFDQPRWQLIRNVVNFTSRIRTRTSSPHTTSNTESSGSRSRRRRSSHKSGSSSNSSSRKHSLINMMMIPREDSEERESNEARRQLTSALNRTSFFQLPGSIFIEEIENDALKRRSANQLRRMMSSGLQRGSIPSEMNHFHAAAAAAGTEPNSLLNPADYGYNYGGNRSSISSTATGRNDRRRSSVHEESLSRTLSIQKQHHNHHHYQQQQHHLRRQQTVDKNNGLPEESATDVVVVDPRAHNSSSRMSFPLVYQTNND